MIGLAIFGWICILMIALWATVATFVVFGFWRVLGQFEWPMIGFPALAIAAWLLCLTSVPFSIVWRGLGQ